MKQVMIAIIVAMVLTACGEGPNWSPTEPNADSSIVERSTTTVSACDTVSEIERAMRAAEEAYRDDPYTPPLDEDAVTGAGILRDALKHC